MTTRASSQAALTASRVAATPTAASWAVTAGATAGPARRCGSRATSRQWSREYTQRVGEAQELRRLLDQEQFEVGDLDQVIQQMRELDDLRRYQDPETIAKLQAFVLEELKRFEYRLRREITEENEELFLAGNEEMPDGFRDLVEEYFRSLSQVP